MNVLKTISIAIGILIVVVVVSAGLFLAGQQIRRWVAPIEGETGVQEFRNSSENRIIKYNHFFDLCASVQTNETRIDVFNIELDQYEPGTRDFSRVSSNLNASVIARMNGINQYNADALKDYTGAEFRDSDLPYQLNTDEYIPKGDKTTCASS